MIVGSLFHVRDCQNRRSDFGITIPPPEPLIRRVTVTRQTPPPRVAQPQCGARIAKPYPSNAPPRKRHRIPEGAR